MDYKTTISNSHFNGLVAWLSRSYSSGLVFGSTYLWSHSVDDGTNVGNNAGVCAIVIDGKWGVIHRDGSIALAPQWEKTGEFAEGLCPVKKEGKWGLIDLSGKLVLQPTYDETGSFDNGHLMVTAGNQLMYLDKSLKPIWKENMACPAGTQYKMYKAPA